MMDVHFLPLIRVGIDYWLMKYDQNFKLEKECFRLERGEMARRRRRRKVYTSSHALNMTSSDALLYYILT